MTKKNWNIKIIGSILLFLFINSSFSVFSFPQSNNTLSQGDSVEKSEELKLSISPTAWSTTEVVSIECEYDSYYPTIAVDSAGNAHVAWYDWTNYSNSGADDWDIFYKRRSATSNTWTATEVVSIEGTSDSLHPTIAVDSAGNAHVAWYDYTNYDGSGTDPDIFYRRWNATSSMWTTTEVVSTESMGDSLHPTIAVDNVGNAYVAWHDQTMNYSGSGADWDIFYKRWNTTSNTWTPTEVVSTESGYDSYNSTIAVDDFGNAHVAWHDATNYTNSGGDWDIFYKRWNTTSSTWTTTEVVSTQSTLDSLNPTIAVNSTYYAVMWPFTGNVYVAWHDVTNYDQAGTDWDIFYKLWNTTSDIWTPTEVVSTESERNSFDPTIAVDSFTSVHIAWHDATNYSNSGADDWDIFYKQRSATSNTWTSTEVVSIEGTSDSLHPTIAVEGAGNAHVAWDDSTDFRSSGTAKDIFYRQSNPLLSGPGEWRIPGYNIFLLIGIICVVSVILFKKRNKIKL